MMERTLRSSLDKLVARYSEATKMTAAMITKRAINDNTFFTRLATGETGFNIRTYDRIVLWMSETWPTGVDWPEGVDRPVKSTAAA